MHHFLVRTARETAGAARTRSSLRPPDEGGKFLSKARAQGVARRQSHIQCRQPRRRVTQYSRDADDRTETPRRTGSPAFAEDDSDGWSDVPRHDEKAMASPDLPAELKAALEARLKGFSRNDAAERSASISKT